MTDNATVVNTLLNNAAATKSSFLSGFWIGKAVQLLQAIKSDPTNATNESGRIKELLQDCRRFETSLSRNVAERIFYAPDPKDNAPKIEDLLNLEGCLNMVHFSKQNLVGPEVVSLTEEESFIKSGRGLYFSSVVLHESLMKTDLESFKTKYSHLFTITQLDKLIYELYDEHLRGRSAMAFLGLSTVLERLLSDAWRVYNYKSNQSATTKAKLTFEQRVPKKLSDLLLTRELKALLGEDLVFLLRAFIGPLSGINLRNILWHGFMAPHEFDACYTSFLFHLFVTVSHQLQAPFAAKQFETPALHSFAHFDHVIDNKHMTALPIRDLSSNQVLIKHVKSLIDQSFFVLPKTESQWHSALEFHLHGEYYKSLLLLFPLIEHSLRRIYVIVNKCADRRLTAESDVLYTTLDILLNFKYDDITMDINKNSIIDNSDENNANKPDNEIFNELGDSLMSYIYDLFVWGDIGEENLTLFGIKKSMQSQTSDVNTQSNTNTNAAPDPSSTSESDADTMAPQPVLMDLTETKPLRLRDMIAHGLVDPTSISHTFSEYCWTLALCLASKYDLRGEFFSESELNLGKFMQNFTPRFHPMTLLLNEIELFSQEWKRFNAQFNPFSIDGSAASDADNRPIKLNYPSNSLKQPAGLPPSFDKPALERELIDVINTLHARKGVKMNWFHWETLINADPVELLSLYVKIQARGATQRKTTLVGILRKVVYHCYQMLYEIRVRYDYLKKIVDDRTAWKRHRVNYSQLVELLPYLSLAIVMLMCTVEVFISNDLQDLFVTVNSGRSESAVMLTWSCSGSLLSIIQGNKWVKAAELVKCFVSPSVPTSAEQLSKKDLAKLWANYHAFMSQL